MDYAVPINLQDRDSVFLHASANFFFRQSGEIVLDEELLTGGSQTNGEKAIDRVHMRDTFQVVLGERAGELERRLYLRHRHQE